MKLCRFEPPGENPRIGIVHSDTELLDLTPAGITSLTLLFEDVDFLTRLKEVAAMALPRVAISGVQILAPLENQEVWAAGVTYLRSKKARMEESEMSATAYDLVYEADRPELFFKSIAHKVVPPREPVGIRRDGTWNVPEPELTLVFNSRGRLVGYTIGNDMSSRDIEGANVLYLPQAKIYHRSCAAGPYIRVGVTEEEVRSWKVWLSIKRAGETVFHGETQLSQLKRSFNELGGYLFRSQVFPFGALLLTGTGIVPPDSFTLQEDDWVSISIEGIGLLENPVIVV